MGAIVTIRIGRVLVQGYLRYAEWVGHRLMAAISTGRKTFYGELIPRKGAE